jgi:putative molybdenum carrier protein
VKIISGGQTGVDRAALDVALKHGIEGGGWCPTGRVDEFGKIPDRYPVKELESGGFTERTQQNVKDSDGTVIIYPGKLTGGTEQTAQFCIGQQRPHLLVDASRLSGEDAARLIGEFVLKNKIDILNVAGPRQSEWAEGYDYTTSALEAFVNSITSRSGSKRRNYS